MLCPKFHSVMSMEEGLIAWYCEAHNLQLEVAEPMEIRVERCVSDRFHTCELFQWIDEHDLISQAEAAREAA